MALKARSQIIQAGDTVQLRAIFRDGYGNPVDLDGLPTIIIVQPSGTILLGPTSDGVTKIATGQYNFNYEVGINPSLGVYSDIWDGFLSGSPVYGELEFIVHNTQMPFVNTDGYVHLGDDPGFNYSQTAIRNINILLKTLRARLDSRGKTVMKDEFGNDVLVDCDIFSIDSLVSFIADSLASFNEIPHFTAFTFEDTEFLKIFHNIIVQGATLMALSSKALLERGREFQFTDNGVNFNPPTVSELMNTEWQAELNNHFEKIKLIKQNMKPSPISLGTLTISTSRHPAIRRLRHLRARQLY